MPRRPGGAETRRAAELHGEASGGIAGGTPKGWKTPFFVCFVLRCFKYMVFLPSIFGFFRCGVCSNVDVFFGIDPSGLGYFVRSHLGLWA